MPLFNQKYYLKLAIALVGAAYVATFVIAYAQPVYPTRPVKMVVGFPAGIARLPLNLTLLKSCDVCGVFWGAFAAREPKANAVHIATLFDLLKNGKINPKVSATFPLERGGEAITMLADRKAIGKVVVTMN